MHVTFLTIAPRKEKTRFSKIIFFRLRVCKNLPTLRPLSWLFTHRLFKQVVFCAEQNERFGGQSNDLILFVF